MKQKKNRFLTLIFSMMFGAGQMYMGFMKQGLSIMGCTLAVIAIGDITQLSIVYLILPLLWFYSFFDGLNKRAMADELFMKLEDISIFPFEINTQRIKEFMDKYQIYIGGGFIFLGICILNNSVLAHIFPGSWFLLRIVGPQFFISVVIIAIGVRMILSKKQELFSLWKFQKNTADEYFKQERTVKPVTKAQEPVESRADFQNNFFREGEENSVSMTMFKPENVTNNTLEDSLNMEVAE